MAHAAEAEEEVMLAILRVGGRNDNPQPQRNREGWVAVLECVGESLR
jgi:hypothetical protein